jgi:two-component system, LuxR family, sensor kinase FixL
MEKGNPNAELQERLRFETLIADLSSKFVNVPAGEVDREIMDAQRRICELLDLDLLAFWQWLDEIPGSFALTHLYSAQEGPLPAGQLSQEDYPWVRRQLAAGRNIILASLNEMPAEAARDREASCKLGIKSNLTLPLAVEGGLTIGAFCLNTTRAERDWPDVLVKRLQLVAQIFANALARKRTELTLREREERLTLAAAYAEVGLWELDYASQAFWTSERAQSLFGYLPNEVVTLDRFKASVHPDDWSFVQESIERAEHADEPINVEYRIRLGDGRMRWISSRGRPHLPSAGKTKRLMGVSIDITERKRIEEALRASEARLAAGTDLAGLGYYEVDYGERNCFLDDRFRDICGIPPDSQQGLRPVEFWLEHVYPEDRRFLLDERQKLHDGKVDRISTEYRYMHPASGQKWIHHLARIASRSATGGGVRTYGVVRDITKAKRTERETQELRDNLMHLTRVNTMSVLSGSLAHELNQPLGIILSNAQAAQEMLLQEPPDVAEVQAILSDIVAADRRAGEVIDRLRALLKPGHLSLQPLPLNEVIEEVLRLINADLIGRGVQVVRELAPGLMPIAGDRVQLQQLVLNLILNGADAMAANAPGTRRLLIKTKLHQDRVQTSVQDDGCGLPANVEQLFQPFYTTKTQGLGMGLAICRSIVDAHRGRLWAEPHPEAGAVFHFELPIAGSQEEP